MIVYLNGQFIEDSVAAINIYDAGFLYGHGVYETLRTYNGKLKFVAEHYKRLQHSAKAAGITLPLSPTELDEILGQLIDKHPAKADLRLRLTLTAGSANFVASRTGEPTLLITAKPIADRASAPLRLVSYNGERAAPEVKSTSMLVNVFAQIYAHKHNADEAILVNHRREITEGSFCNIFIVKEKALITPTTGILRGITRQIVLDLVKSEMPTFERVVTLDEALSAEEIFITSTVRGIVPIQQFNERKYPVPGPVTKKLSDQYNQKVFA